MLILMVFVVCAAVCVYGLVKPNVRAEFDKRKPMPSQWQWIGTWFGVFVFCALLSTCFGGSEEVNVAADNLPEEKPFVTEILPPPFNKIAEAKGTESTKNIPKELIEHINSHQIINAALENGVLKVIYNEDILPYQYYESFAHGSCYPLYVRNNDGWNSVRITRIEVLNSIAAQGYALQNPRSFCDKIGKMTGDEPNLYLKNVSFVCVAGSCRQREVGEVASGDYR